MGPIDYLGAMPQIDFARDIQGGLAAGQLFQQRNLQNEQKQAALDSAKQYKLDIQTAMQNPTPQSFSALALKYPSQREAIKQSWDGLSEGDRKQEGDTMAQAYSALLSGQPEIAKQVVQSQIEARKNSGLDTSHYDSALSLLNTDPQKAQGALGFTLAHINDPKAFATQFGALGQEGRSQELFGDEKREKGAKADEAVSKAATAGVEAKYAEPKAKADLSATASQLGLTKAQTQSALASAGNMSANTQKTLLETQQLKQNGGVPTDKKFALESDLRKEYSTQTKHFTDVKEAFARIKSAENTGAGDIALVYSYMKILDPTSVVREGEFATAQNSAGIPAAVVAAYNKALNGERLTKGQRDSFQSQGQKLLNAAGVREKEVRKGIDNIAGNYGLNKGNIYFNDADVTNAGAQQANGQQKNIVVDF
jgi:hypothetical protein